MELSRPTAINRLDESSARCVQRRTKRLRMGIVGNFTCNMVRDRLAMQQYEMYSGVIGVIEHRPSGDENGERTPHCGWRCASGRRGSAEHRRQRRRGTSVVRTNEVGNFFTKIGEVRIGAKAPSLILRPGRRRQAWRLRRVHRETSSQRRRNSVEMECIRRVTLLAVEWFGAERTQEYVV